MSAPATLAPEPFERVPSAPSADHAEGHVSARRIEANDWDCLVSAFDDVCQEQLYAFASARWPGTALEPQVFERNGRVVGGALVMVQRLPLGIGEIAICKWGPMLADDNASSALADSRAMIDALIAEYAVRRGMMVSLMLQASTGPEHPLYPALLADGFRDGSGLAYPSRYLVNLSLDDAAQRASFHQTWRRQLSKAEKSGLSFHRVEPGQVEEFKTLYTAMSERKQFPDYSAYATLDNLLALPEPLRPEIFLVRHGEELVGGAVIFTAGKRAVYLYGATSDNALPLRAGYFLHWQVIRWLRENTRAQWYDLGGSDGFKGLHQFKSGMVGEAGRISSLPPIVNYAAGPIPYVLGTAAFAARALVGQVRQSLSGMRSKMARPDMPPEIKRRSSP